MICLPGEPFKGLKPLKGFIAYGYFFREVHFLKGIGSYGLGIGAFEEFEGFSTPIALCVTSFKFKHFDYG